MSLIVVILSIWLGVVFLVVSFDAATSYRAERQTHKNSRKTQTKAIPATRPCSIDESLLTAIEKYRRTRQREIGVVLTIDQRPARPRCSRSGTHRRLKVS